MLDWQYLLCCWIPVVISRRRQEGGFIQQNQSTPITSRREAATDPTPLHVGCRQAYQPDFNRHSLASFHEHCKQQSLHQIEKVGPVPGWCDFSYKGALTTCGFGIESSNANTRLDRFCKASIFHLEDTPHTHTTFESTTPETPSK